MTFWLARRPGFVSSLTSSPYHYNFILIRYGRSHLKENAGLASQTFRQSEGPSQCIIGKQERAGNHSLQISHG